MDPFSITTGPGPLVATAVHDGHAADPDTLARFALDDKGRLREEDPFTGEMAEVAPTRILGRRSRFEVDLNRPPERAVYRTPDDAWGLTVWKEDLPDAVAERSMGIYDDFYTAVGALLDEKVREHGSVVVYDLHTYNHKREGPDGPLADAEKNPEVNIGTGSLDARWAPLVKRFMRELKEGAQEAGRDDLDVRENVKFKGGHFSRWIHERYGDAACVIAVEFKKTFMDEWSGEVDRAHLEQIKAALAHTVTGTLQSRAAVMAIASEPDAPEA